MATLSWAIFSSRLAIAFKSSLASLFLLANSFSLVFNFSLPASNSAFFALYSSKASWYFALPSANSFSFAANWLLLSFNSFSPWTIWLYALSNLFSAAIRELFALASWAFPAWSSFHFSSSVFCRLLVFDWHPLIFYLH